MSDADEMEKVRSQLIEAQSKLIVSQEIQLATLRLGLRSAQETIKQQEQELKRHRAVNQKGMQA